MKYVVVFYIAYFHGLNTRNVWAFAVSARYNQDEINAMAHGQITDREPQHATLEINKVLVMDWPLD